MKPFHDNFMAKWNAKFVAPLERDLGVKLADFADLPQGQFTFAVTQNGWNGSDDAKRRASFCCSTRRTKATC